MKTAQRMLATTPRTGAPILRASAALTLAALLVLVGCTQPREEPLLNPRVLVAPYALYDPDQPDALWAIAPLRNESGTSIVDTLSVSDALVAQTHQVRGVSVVPLNRTIAAMRVLQMQSVDTPDDAHALIETLGVDAIVVGTITAYDPYDPPVMGMSVALFVRPGSLLTTGSPDRGGLDPRTLRSTARETSVPHPEWSTAPTSVASEHLNAANHEVQMAVRTFGEGRSSTRSALGWRRYLASMPLYADFVSYRITERLLDAERARLARTHDHAAR